MKPNFYLQISFVLDKHYLLYNKLGCASVKLIVWLKFTETLSDLITKKDMKFFFQIEKESVSPA